MIINGQSTEMGSKPEPVPASGYTLLQELLRFALPIAEVVATSVEAQCQILFELKSLGES